MDGFSSYNQIIITEENRYKITFKIPWGTYVYKVMPFFLKNVGVTYQQAMNYILHDYIHDIVEDYMGDLISNPKHMSLT